MVLMTAVKELAQDKEVQYIAMALALILAGVVAVYAYAGTLTGDVMESIITGIGLYVGAVVGMLAFVGVIVKIIDKV